MDIYIVNQKGIILFYSTEWIIDILTMSTNDEKKSEKFQFLFANNNNKPFNNFSISMSLLLYRSFSVLILAIIKFFFFGQTTSIDARPFFIYDIFQKELYICNQDYIRSITFLSFHYTMAIKATTFQYYYYIYFFIKSISNILYE